MNRTRLGQKLLEILDDDGLSDLFLDVEVADSRGVKGRQILINTNNPLDLRPKLDFDKLRDLLCPIFGYPLVFSINVPNILR